MTTLRERIRLAAGRARQPSTAITDSQQVDGLEIIARTVATTLSAERESKYGIGH